MTRVRPPASFLVTLVVALTTALSAVLAAPGVARAAEPAPTVLTLAATGGYADGPVRLSGTLLTTEGVPVAAGTVALERRTARQWVGVGTTTTDDAGRFTLSTVRSRVRGQNVFRATYAGDPTYAASSTTGVTSTLRRRAVRLTLSGPRRVVDERAVVLGVRWTSASGVPASGRVQVQRRERGGRWARAGVVTTGPKGLGRLRVRPRVDTQWRALSPRLDWLGRGRSAVLTVDNVPPGTPVVLPAGAPRPRITLPPQQRATAAGAAPVISAITDGVWRSMVGRSWHEGCPVGREGLRLVRVNYWGFDGYRYRGEVVAATWAAPKMAAALKEMYDRRLPIRAMYRVDRFGWSKALQGADDYASMAADNTSAFNCRSVVNKPGVRSPHSYGGSLDVNPWENPYRSATGLVPNTWWASRTHPLVAWRSSSHAVVATMNRHGMRWTYGTGDSHHFDATRSGRVVLPAGCRSVVCH